MDPNRNPFNPGAGIRPPELAGRKDELEGALLALNRIKNGRYERSFIYYGLRGVGKTVLLADIRKKAENLGYLAEMLEAQDGQSLVDMLTPTLRAALLQLDSVAKSVESVKRGLRVLRSFIGKVRIDVGDRALSIDVDPEPGKADSGNLERDISELLKAVGEAAKGAERPIAFLIDEMQYLSKDDLSILYRSVHSITQANLPLVFFGAGLPQLPGMSGEAKSYAERLFDFIPLGRLADKDAWAAIREPVKEEGATISDEALVEIINETKGYPYFLQEWGYNAWTAAPGPEITASDAKEATARSITKLDKSFFRVRFDRTTPGEREYMFALAQMGEGAHKSAEVAKHAKKNVKTLGPVRDSLIKKGMIYSPEHGLIAFSVPLFDEFMLRQMGVT
jgi:hypothetical protein